MGNGMQIFLKKKKKEGCDLMCTIKSTAKTLDILELNHLQQMLTNTYLSLEKKSFRHYLACLIVSTDPCDRSVCNEWFSDC